MGNSNSSTSSSTSNWKRYQVEHMEKDPYTVKFTLDSNTEFSNEYSRYLYCQNTYPYNRIHAGWYIEVNQTKSQYYNSSYKFNGCDNLSIIRIPEPAFDYAPVSVSELNWRENLCLESDSDEEFFEDGIHVIKRTTERQGDLIVEYIKKIEVKNGKTVANIETWKYKQAY